MSSHCRQPHLTTRVRGRPRGDRGRFGNRVRNDRGQVVVRRRPQAAAVVAQPLPPPVAPIAPIAPVGFVAHAAPVHVNPFLRTTVAQVLFDNMGVVGKTTLYPLVRNILLSWF